MFQDKAGLLKPWVVWTSLQLIAGVLLFVLWSTMNVITQFDDNALLLYMMEFLGLGRCIYTKDQLFLRHQCMYMKLAERVLLELFPG